MASRTDTVTLSPGGRQPTVNDVGAEAGVSRQTVTRAMNNMPGISAATRERVLAAAHRLNYRPSRFGRGLVNQRPHNLGLVVDDLVNPYFAEFASALVAAADARHWNALLIQTAHVGDPERQLIEMGGEVDAMVGYHRGVRGAMADTLRGLPYVEIDLHIRPDGIGVILDVNRGLHELADHLQARGVRRPAVVDIPGPERPSYRMRRFIDIMGRHGYRDIPIVDGAANSMDAAMAATREILAEHSAADMIMAFNDLTACGVLKALRHAGIDVPGQIRVAGIDGLRIGTYVTPQLTTLAIDLPRAAAAAVDLAIRLAEGEPTPKTRPRVACRLQVGAST